MKILVIGGTFDENKGKRSTLIQMLIDSLMSINGEISYRNGGSYDELNHLLEDNVKEYDVVFWMPNVQNHLPKIRDVKKVAPYTLLVSSKRNDNNKYSFKELVNHALSLKANLTFEFKKQENGRFKISLFDPLGCMWYEGQDMVSAATAAFERLKFLLNITRNRTYQSKQAKELVLAYYFDRFQEYMEQSEENVKIPKEDEFTHFVDIVKEHAEQFQKIMQPPKNVERFLGNASIRPPQVGRCSKGMPSFRKGKYIFVSQRNIDKQFISIENFVPSYIENGKVFYCGNDKPSVDTPVQLRLYERMPKINFMIHSHCYILGAPFTEICYPCGAIEEVDEICKTLKKAHGLLDLSYYTINLIGHGSIVFASDVDTLRNVKYYGRPMPEKMF